MTTTILVLLIAFQLKHLIADYYLQFPYMYENKGAKKNWFWPLFDHTLVHAAGTVIILSVYAFTVSSISGFYIVPLATLDLATHFVTDRWKATRGRTPNESKFWYDLGIDQMVHHTVGILIVYLITQG